MTKTVRKVGSDLVEGDVVVGDRNRYLVVHPKVLFAAPILRRLETAGCFESLIVPDVPYEVEVKTRSRRERIETAIELWNLYPIPPNVSKVCSLAQLIEAELDADD